MKMSELIEKLDVKHDENVIVRIKELVSKKPIYASSLDEILKKERLFRHGRTVGDRMKNSSLNQVMAYLRSGGNGLSAKAVKRKQAEINGEMHYDVGDYLISKS